MDESIVEMNKTDPGGSIKYGSLLLGGMPVNLGGEREADRKIHRGLAFDKGIHFNPR